MSVGSARCYGAITIVNAIPTGFGAAMGIKLWTEAEVRLREEPGIDVEIVGAPGEDLKLAREAVRIVLEKMRPRFLGARVTTKSTIPIGRGLKSSSAAANAIVLATAKALGLSLPPDDAVRLSVKAAIRAGVTITGAYDDAYTSMMGGINLTDNFKKIVLKRWKIDEGLRVLILVPEKKQYTAEVDVEALKRIRTISERAAQLTVTGKFWEAMTLNGLAVASALNLDPTPIFRALRKGVLGAGVSGTGPAIAAVSVPGLSADVKKALEEFGLVLEVEPNNSPAEVE